MQKHEVRDANCALAYLTDCILATVEGMASKKTRGKHEYSRQIAIAQQAIDWMDAFGVDYRGTRAEKVRRAGSVIQWASEIESP